MTKQPEIKIDHFTYRGFSAFQSICKLEIYGLTEGNPVVVMTELQNNPGTSVTNACETIAEEAYKQFIQPHGIIPERVRFVEHYPASPRFPETWDEITFTIDPKGTRIFTNPQWKRINGLDWT